MKKIDSFIAAGDPWSAQVELNKVIRNEILFPSIEVQNENSFSATITSYVDRITHQLLDKKAVDILDWLTSSRISQYVTPEISRSVLEVLIDREWWRDVRRLMLSNLITKDAAMAAMTIVEQKLSPENIRLPKNIVWVAPGCPGSKNPNVGFKVMSSPAGFENDPDKPRAIIKMNEAAYLPISPEEYVKTLKDHRAAILYALRESVAHKK